MRLVADSVAFSFGRRAIVTDLSVNLGPGESAAIIGPSGVGKTTVLALLGGLLQPQQGTIRVQDGGRGPHPAGSVAWVLQTINVFNDRSVLDNVAVGALADGCGRPEAEEIAVRSLRRVGLDERSSDPVRRLSGGEMQRVVIARALASARPFILADEPTGQLDTHTTQSVLDALIGSSDARGLLVVTHDPAVASRCDRTLVLNDGTLVET